MATATLREHLAPGHLPTVTTTDMHEDLHHGHIVTATPMRASTTEDTDMTMSTVMEAMGSHGGSRRQAGPGHCHSLGLCESLRDGAEEADAVLLKPHTLN